MRPEELTKGMQALAELLHTETDGHGLCLIREMLHQWSDEASRALLEAPSRGKAVEELNAVLKELSGYAPDELSVLQLEELEIRLTTILTGPLGELGSGIMEAVEDQLGFADRRAGSAGFVLLLFGAMGLQATIEGRNFDSVAATCNIREMGRDTLVEEQTPRLELTAEETAALKLAHEEPHSMKYDDWKVVRRVARKGQDVTKEPEFTERFNKACAAIPEFKPGEKVTAKHLTALFSAKHEAAKVHLKRTEGEVLPDVQKLVLAELVESFRAKGGKVFLDGLPCVLQALKNSSMKQRRFVVKDADASRTTRWASIKVPLLTFENP